MSRTRKVTLADLGLTAGKRHSHWIVVVSSVAVRLSSSCATASSSLSSPSVIKVKSRRLPSSSHCSNKATRRRDRWNSTSVNLKECEIGWCAPTSSISSWCCQCSLQSRDFYSLRYLWRLFPYPNKVLHYLLEVGEVLGLAPNGSLV